MGSETAQLMEQKRLKKKRPKHESEDQSEDTTKKKKKSVDKTSKLGKLDDVQENKVITPKTGKRKKKKHKKLKETNDNETEVQGEKEKTDVQKLCLQYLKDWKTNREKWSFQKVRQVWLLKHMYNENKVPDEDFTILLDYLEGLKGKAREVTIQNAEKLLNDNDTDSDNSDKDDDDAENCDDESAEAKSKTKSSENKGQRLSDKQCDRIRQVLQILP